MASDGIFPPWIEKEDGTPDYQLMADLAKSETKTSTTQNVPWFAFWYWFS